MPMITEKVSCSGMRAVRMRSRRAMERVSTMTVLVGHAG